MSCERNGNGCGVEGASHLLRSPELRDSTFARADSMMGAMTPA